MSYFSEATLNLKALSPDERLPCVAFVNSFDAFKQQISALRTVIDDIQTFKLKSIVDASHLANVLRLAERDFSQQPNLLCFKDTCIPTPSEADFKVDYKDKSQQKIVIAGDLHGTFESFVTIMNQEPFDAIGKT